MKGLIHLYIGDGKGKTSAAIGLAVRAAGSGMKVTVARFLKSSDSGEVAALKSIAGITVLDTPAALPFYFMMDEGQKKDYAVFAAALLEDAFKADCGAIILDEALDALELGLISERRLLCLLNGTNAEVVLTGRRATDELRQAAGYITRFDCEKHPYFSGIPARKGIEY